MTATSIAFPVYFGSAAAAIGVVVIVGWVADLPMLTKVWVDSIPVAPNTAAALILMGCCLPTLSVTTDCIWRRIGVGVSALVVFLTGLREILEYIATLRFGVDSWLITVQDTSTYQLAPIGKMALYTAVSLFAAGCSAILIAMDRPRLRSLGGGIGLAVAVVGTTFALGFFVGSQLPPGATPLLASDEPPIPMAFGTAVGLVLLGTGLAAAAGPLAFPLRPFAGSSGRARLLRVFLPLTVAASLVSAWLANWSARSDNPYRAVVTSAVGVASALAAAFVCGRIAANVGADLERAERQLRKARDELEDRVVERTAQLCHANHELRRTQSQLVHTEKLAGLGQLVAGVAHEINNPLAFVSNNFAVLEGYTQDLTSVLTLYRQSDSELAERRPALSAEIAETAEQVQLDYILSNTNEVFVRTKDGLKRIFQIVKDLREFARLDRCELETVDINAGIESTINIVRGRAGKQRISLETVLGTLPSVTCYPAKINQVVMNLVANAIDACEEGGRVAVRTRAVNGGVEIDVEDDGSGIEPAIRDKLFDPFFTTKPVGQGTGLGLSISYGIVQDHRGRLEVASEPGKGATFTVFLPTGAEL